VQNIYSVQIKVILTHQDKLLKHLSSVLLIQIQTTGSQSHLNSLIVLRHTSVSQLAWARSLCKY
jgi:hypothetical protein